MNNQNNQGLSKREKFLIFAAVGFLIIVVSAQFIIRPMFDSFSEKQEERDALTLQRNEINNRLLGEPAVRGNFEAAEASVEELRARYPVFLLNPEISRRLTELCGKHNLSRRTLSISEPIGWQKPLEDGSIPVAPPPAEGEEGEGSAIVVYTVSANMTLSGTRAAFDNLIRELEDTEYIRITRFVLADEGPEDAIAGMSSNISVFFEITMLGDI